MAFRIDKVYYINQDVRVDRHWTQLFALELFGVPYDRVARFPSRIQNNDLPSYDEMVDMMVADGFTEWEMLKKRELKTDPTWLASQWSKLSVIRSIMDNGENGILLSDINYLSGFDRTSQLGGFRPPMTFANLETACGKLDGLKVLNLQCPWDRWSFLENKDITIQESRADGMFYPMFAGRFGAILFTQEGAKSVLDWCKEFPYVYTDNIFASMFRDDRMGDGFYFCHPSIVMTLNKVKGYPYNRVDKNRTRDGLFYEQ